MTDCFGPRLIASRGMIALVITASLALSGCTHWRGPYREREELRLTHMLDGRVAGRAHDCIPGTRSDRLTIIDGEAVIYDDGDRLWVARPARPALLVQSRIVIGHTVAGQLCVGDFSVRSGRNGALVPLILQGFTPYRRR